MFFAAKEEPGVEDSVIGILFDLSAIAPVTCTYTGRCKLSPLL